MGEALSQDYRSNKTPTGKNRRASRRGESNTWGERTTIEQYVAELNRRRHRQGKIEAFPDREKVVISLYPPLLPGSIADMSRKIGVTGFEPATSCTQSRRSSQAELHPVENPS